MTAEFERFWDEIGTVPLDSLPLAEMDSRVRLLVERYKALCGPDGRIPGRQDIDPADLTAVLPVLHMMDVVPGSPRRFRYRLVGTRLVTQIGRDITGTYMDEYKGGVDAAHRSANHVVDHRAMSWRRGQPLLPHLPEYKWLERLLLPLARDGRNVDMTIGVTVLVDRPTG